MVRLHILHILFLLTVSAELAFGLIMSAPQTNRSTDIQGNSSEKSTGTRLLGNETLRGFNGQYCAYDCYTYRCGFSTCRACSGSSQYCVNGCCGSIYSTRNDVCCNNGGPNDTSATIGLLLGLILGFSTTSILLL